MSLKKSVIVPVAVLSISMLAAFSSMASTKKVKLISYVNLTVDSDIEEGMTIGDEKLDVDSKTSHVDIKEYGFTDIGDPDHEYSYNADGNVKKKLTYTDDDEEDDEENVSDAEWHDDYVPEITVTLEVEDSDYKLNLTSRKNVKVSGTADAVVKSVSGSGDTAKVVMEVRKLQTGSAAVDAAKVDADTFTIQFGSTPDDAHYNVSLYKDGKLYGQYRTEDGADTFDLIPYVDDAGSYVAKVQMVSGSGLKSSWRTMNEAITITDDEIKAIIAGKQLSYNDPYTRTDSDGVWKQNKTGWWWEENNGAYPVSQWRRINNLWYYFNEKGYMTEGLQYISGNWYYFKPSSGHMKTGWNQINGQWYYFDLSNGTMKFGWQKINGKWYYFNPSNGAMLSETTTPDGHKVNANGEMIA